MLVGIGLLAIAPCTYLLMGSVTDPASVIPSSVQLAGALLFFAAAFRARNVHRDPDNAASTRPFAEKSAMIVMLGLLVVSAVYFGNVWGSSMEEAIPAVFGAVALLVVLMIAGHIVIALFHAPSDELDEPEDERDRAISLRGMRNAYYVLVAAFWSVPIVIVAPLPVLTALNLWFAALVLAELVYYGSVVALYRYGTA